MTNCPNIKADLSAYIDGELTPARATEIRAHLDACPDCRRLETELRRLSAGIGALPKVQPAPQFLADVRRKIRAPESAAKPWWEVLIFPVWPKVPLEALALVIVVVGVFWVTRSRENQPASQTGPISSLVAPQLPSTKAGGETARNVRILSDQDESTPTAPLAANREPASIAELESANRLSQESKQALYITNALSLGAGGGGSGGGLPLGVLNQLNDASPQIIIATGESLVAVKLRAETLARSLNGRVDSGGASNTLLVSLPQSKVSAFRSRFSHANKSPQLASGSENWTATYAASARRQGPVQSTNLVGLALTNHAAAADGLAADVTKAVSDPVVEVEVVVHPDGQLSGK